MKTRLSRKEKCPICGGERPYYKGKGFNKPTYCSEQCSDEAKIIRRKRILDKVVKCKVDGCNSMANRKLYQLCEKHYMKMRRRGTTEAFEWPKIKYHSSGYILEYAPNHPLAMKLAGNRIYQHRKVYYDNYGDGPFKCHWCGKDLTWETMDIDHVNAAKTDNRIENLVASCPKCNKERAKLKAVAAYKMLHERKLTYNGETIGITTLARRLGITIQSIDNRIKKGWSIERIFTEPRGKYGPRREANHERSQAGDAGDSGQTQPGAAVRSQRR